MSTFSNLVRLCALLVSLGFVARQAHATAIPADGLRYPLDLYFLADASGSIKQEWNQIVNFANSLQNRMALLAGGYFSNFSIEGDGLRVSISTFSCAGQQSRPSSTPLFTKILGGPSGDETKIAGGIADLRRVKPAGGTCPSAGLKGFNKEIDANRANETERPTAVIILTDGAIWGNDLAKTTNVSLDLRSKDDVYMFGINYGGGAAAANQWINMVGNKERVYTSKDLDQVSKILSVIMLGRLDVSVVPTPTQLQRVANFSTSQNTTLCLGESGIPILLAGRSIGLFGASGLQCVFTRLMNNQTFTVTPTAVGAQVFCNLPGSLLREVTGTNTFAQRFSLIVNAVKSGSSTKIFTVPLISFNVVVCLNVQFIGSNPTGEHNCFPAADPTNSSLGLLSFTGPTVDAPGSSFYCAFDSNPRALARQDGTSKVCTVPGVDVSSALLAGTDPTPFRRFTIQTSDGGVLLDSNLDQTSFTPESCINTVAASHNKSYCWNSADSSGSAAVFEGESLTNLIDSYDNLEFTCVYSFSNGTSANVSGSVVSGTTQVKCGPAPLKDLLARAYSITAMSRMLSVSVQVRSSQGSSTRGWWVMQTDTQFPVIVSPCLSSTVPASPVCLGTAFAVTFGNEGVTNIFGADESSACLFLDTKGKTLAAVPVSVAGQQATCAWPQATPLLKSVLVKGLEKTYLNQSLTAGNVVPCLNIQRSIAEQQPSETVCWGPALSREEVSITGTSIAYYLNASKQAPTCRFRLDDTGTTVRSVATLAGGSLVCGYPKAFGLRPAPFASNLSFVLEDSNLDFEVADPLGPFTLRISSCVTYVAGQLNVVDQGKALPPCAPTCCLQTTLSAMFEGDAADNISTCDWMAANNTILASTTASDTNNSIGICSLKDWQPLVPGSAIPVAKVVAYADGNKTAVLGSAQLQSRQSCVWANFDDGTQITYGSALKITFNGPTMRALTGLVNIKCGLMSSSSSGNSTLLRVVTATKASTGGFTCILDKMYDSLEGASVVVSVVPLETGGSTQETQTASTAETRSDSETSSNRRRLRQVESKRMLQQEQTQGVQLYSQTLNNVQVSSRVSAALSPSNCIVPTAPALQVLFSGAGASVLKDQLVCAFEVPSNSTILSAPDNSTMVNGTSVVVLPTYNATSGQITCGIQLATSSNGKDFNGAISYVASIVREDTGALLSIASGSSTACSSAPIGGTTPAPTAASAAAGIGAGGIAGIIIALIALIVILVVAVFIDRKRKNDRDNRRNNEKKQAEADAAAAAAAASAGNKKLEYPEHDNTAEVPVSLVDPSIDAASTLPNDDFEDDLIVVPVDGTSSSGGDRKFRIGDCVQCLDPVDDSWRYTYIRNFGQQPLEYIVEDERQAVHESRMRWPHYHAGEPVEVRRKKESGDEWVPGVVAFCEPDDGIVGLMGTDAEEVAAGDVRPAPFKLGENVEERGPDGEWRPAVITSCEPDGTYLVDGAGGLGLNRTRKRLRWPQYHGGDIVEVRVPDSTKEDGSTWKRATVVTMEGGVVVALEDGVIDPKRFQNQDVRRPMQPMLKSAPPTPIETSLLNDSSMMGDEQSSPRRKYKRREPLDFQELPDFCFEITIDKKHGMGVRFGWTRDQLIVVQKFLGLPGMDAGPLEASEKVSLGDQLLALNGTSIGGRSFAEVTDMIRTSPDIVTLKFGRWKETVKMKGAPRRSEGPADLSVV